MLRIKEQISFTLYLYLLHFFQVMGYQRRKEQKQTKVQYLNGGKEYTNEKNTNCLNVDIMESSIAEFAPRDSLKPLQFRCMLKSALTALDYHRLQTRALL